METVRLNSAPTLGDWRSIASPKVLDLINITGWRNVYGTPDTFCDFISVATCRGWDFKAYPATTRPGVPYLLKPMTPKGSAIVVPGYYKDVYRLGLHKGKEALVQAGPLSVYRDNNKDGVFDTDITTVENGMFGIDIHRAGLLSLIVGNWSAGCQVFKREKDFLEFLQSVKASRQTVFSYTLVEFTYGL